MGELIELDEMRPHYAGWATCSREECGHVACVVVDARADINHLECPQCGEMTAQLPPPEDLALGVCEVFRTAIDFHDDVITQGVIYSDRPTGTRSQGVVLSTLRLRGDVLDDSWCR